MTLDTDFSKVEMRVLAHMLSSKRGTSPVRFSNTSPTGRILKDDYVPSCRDLPAASCQTGKP